ncbi:MAG: hypothetical protein K8U03_18250 [Planctomycetia bacterium]|nr:hypothetical protein [Planctomycetia bacterium]
MSSRPTSELPARCSGVASTSTSLSSTSKGRLRWITQAGGVTGDNAYTLACNEKHGIVIGGSFSGTAKFGDAEITSGGATDLYVAKLKAD